MCTAINSGIEAWVYWASKQSSKQGGGSASNQASKVYRVCAQMVYGTNGVMAYVYSLSKGKRPGWRRVTNADNATRG